jgi:hypothetical protein
VALRTVRIAAERTPHLRRHITLSATEEIKLVNLGRKGGKEIAKRGPEYFKQFQARRKKRKSGRPPKSKKSLTVLCPSSIRG